MTWNLSWCLHKMVVECAGIYIWPGFQKVCNPYGCIWDGKFGEELGTYPDSIYSRTMQFEGTL